MIKLIYKFTTGCNLFPELIPRVDSSLAGKYTFYANFIIRSFQEKYEEDFTFSYLHCE